MAQPLRGWEGFFDDVPGLARFRLHPISARRANPAERDWRAESVWDSRAATHSLTRLIPEDERRADVGPSASRRLRRPRPLERSGNEDCAVEEVRGICGRTLNVRIAIQTCVLKESATILWKNSTTRGYGAVGK